MTTYNTGNPLGSTDVLDRYDNTENLDNLVNGPAVTYNDRLGVSRKSWRGMENDFSALLAASGFETTVLTYTDGVPLQVDRPTQLLKRASVPGTLYSIKLPSSFPVVLSGTWATDLALLVVRVDDALRAELASQVDPAKGAGMVGFDPALAYPAGTIGQAVKFSRAPLADVISTASQMLSTLRVNIWEYENLIISKPTPADPGTWDWSPALQAAINAVSPVGSVEFTEGTFKFSGVTTSKTVSLYGQGAGATVLQNFTAGATMLTYDQVGMADADRRNWLVFDGFTLIDEASFTGIGIKTNNVLSVIFRDCFVRNFKTNYGLQVLEALWVYLENVSSDLCELNFVSTLVPHFNNVISISGGEIRNPTPGRSGLYVEGGDIISLRDSTIEGNAGGAGYISGGKFKNIKMLSIENTYFEVLQQSTQGGIVLENCQAVKIARSQLNSQSTTVPSVLCVDSDSVEFDRCVMVAFPIRSTGINSIKLKGCMSEGPIDLSATTSFEVKSPMPYNTRSAIVLDPSQQSRKAGKPMAFRNSYADSSFDSAAPSTSIIAGAPVSSLDTTRGYFGPNSWRVTGVSGDTIRTASLGVTTTDGQSGCMSFMAKADTAGRFGLLMFLAGSAGGHDIYLSTEWRRYFLITNLRPASTVGAQFLLQLAFQGANAFNITDIQFIPFTDYGEIPGIVDGFNYLPTHGATIPGATSKEVAADKRYFDRGINLRVMTIAPTAPESGDIYFADGTAWNPGAGAGIYQYLSGVYTKL